MNTCQAIHKTTTLAMKALSRSSWPRWNGGASRSARRPESCRASQSPIASPLAAISTVRIQACGHLHVPATPKSSAAIAAYTAIVQMKSFATMWSPSEMRSAPWERAAGGPRRAAAVQNS